MYIKYFNAYYVVIRCHVKLAMTNCEFVTDRMIQGYCIFRTIWYAAAGKSLQCVQDVGNMEDRYVCTLWPFIEVTQ